jgi:hypothetical protein
VKYFGLTSCSSGENAPDIDGMPTFGCEPGSSLLVNGLTSGTNPMAEIAGYFPSRCFSGLLPRFAKRRLREPVIVRHFSSELQELVATEKIESLFEKFDFRHHSFRLDEFVNQKRYTPEITRKKIRNAE